PGGRRERVRPYIPNQRTAPAPRYPDPQALWAEAVGRRVWERRFGDADFGVVRVGTGPQSLATPLVAPTIAPTSDLEPVRAGARRGFLPAYALALDLPVSLGVRSFARVVVTAAEPGAERALARALVG